MTRSQGPSGQRVLHPREAHLDPQLAGAEDHLRGRVEAGDLRLGIAPRAGGGSSRRCRSRARAPARAGTASPRSPRPGARRSGGPRPGSSPGRSRGPSGTGRSRYPRSLWPTRRPGDRSTSTPSPLRSGEAAALDVRLLPAAARVGRATARRSPSGPLAARVDVSRTSLGLRAAAALASDGHGRVRSLPRSRRAAGGGRRPRGRPAVDRRPGAAQPLRREGRLDARRVAPRRAHAGAARAAALPARLRRPLRGLRRVAERFRAGEHRHEPPLDPRFAKLRELTD